MKYEDCPTVEYISRYFGDVMLEYTMKSGARPFGCSVVIAGFDKLNPTTMMPNVKPYPEPRIFLAEPSGAVVEWKAVAIGRNSKALMEFLERHYKASAEFVVGKDLETEERALCELVMSAASEVMQVRHETLEIATMTVEHGVRLLLDSEVDLMSKLLDVEKVENKTAVAASEEESEWFPGGEIHR
mmetsp:Transcript_11050/g.30854  ORF Transcript_11050/g.30854 Transcript_11050/m.30854 type:complete len:186 (-) Transcript_11050:150-707(-)